MVGTAPISAVTIPRPKTAMTMARFRPCLSAKLPNIADPSGRIRRVTANEAYVAAKESVSLSEGKKRGPMVEATKRRMNRSKRSKDQATTEEKTAVRTWRWVTWTCGEFSACVTGFLLLPSPCSVGALSVGSLYWPFVLLFWFRTRKKRCTFAIQLALGGAEVYGQSGGRIDHGGSKGVDELFSQSGRPTTDAQGRYDLKTAVQDRRTYASCLCSPLPR